MSSITGLISGGGGGGTPLMGVARFNKSTITTKFTDESGQVWLKAGASVYGDDLALYPDADVNQNGVSFRILEASSTTSIYGPVTDYDPKAMAFKPDGSAVYIITASRNVVVYELTTPWDITTLTYADKVATGLSSGATSIRFKPDGTKMYILRGTTVNDFVYEFSLSTPWDVSTLSLINTFEFTELSPNEASSFVFSNDGSFFIVQSYNYSYAYWYRMTTPWDTSTASHTLGENRIIGLNAYYTIEADETTNRVFLASSNSNRIYEFEVLDLSDPAATWTSKNNLTGWNLYNGRLFHARPGFERFYTGRNSSGAGLYEYWVNKNIAFISTTNFVNTDYMRIK